jgi:osmotically-inducible protein OsmY
MLNDMNTDTKLKEAVVAQLDFWVGRSAGNVQVAVSDGIATLRGCVPADAEKMQCEETVRRVSGVKEVVNNVVVKPAKLERVQTLTSRLALQT